MHSHNTLQHVHTLLIILIIYSWCGVKNNTLWSSLSEARIRTKLSTLQTATWPRVTLHLQVVDAKHRDVEQSSCYTCLCPRVWKLAACLGMSQTVSSAGDLEQWPAWSPRPAQAALWQSRYGLTLWSHAPTADHPYLPTETCRDTEALSCSITWRSVWQDVHGDYAVFSLVWISENMDTCSLGNK